VIGGRMGAAAFHYGKGKLAWDYNALRPMTRIRLATAQDLDRVLPLMRDFYAFERLPFEETRGVLLQLLSDERLGRLTVFERRDETLAGYLVLGFGFSVEFGGRDALLDEFYVAPEDRGQGIGRAALDFALEQCRAAGIRAVHLEADHFNQRAHEFYLRCGFKDHARHLMTKWL